MNENKAMRMTLAYLVGHHDRGFQRHLMQCKEIKREENKIVEIISIHKTGQLKQRVFVVEEFALVFFTIKWNSSERKSTRKCRIIICAVQCAYRLIDRWMWKIIKHLVTLTLLCKFHFNILNVTMRSIYE